MTPTQEHDRHEWETATASNPPVHHYPEPITFHASRIRSQINALTHRSTIHHKRNVAHAIAAFCADWAHHPKVKVWHAELGRSLRMQLKLCVATLPDFTRPIPRRGESMKDLGWEPQYPEHLKSNNHGDNI